MPSNHRPSRSRSSSPSRDANLRDRRRRFRSRSRSPSRSSSQMQFSIKQHERPHRAHRSYSERLPFNAKELSKGDLNVYTPLFALYLDKRKQLHIDDLDQDEVRGRWKSFTGKWNRGELPEEWYNPKALDEAIRGGVSDLTSRTASAARRSTADDDNEGEDEYGPQLPLDAELGVHQVRRGNLRDAGPAIPSLSDLRARQEQDREDADVARGEEYKMLRNERRRDRKSQKDRLEDLVPRAPAGTRERQLEKRREKADANRTFAAAKDAGGDMDLRDADVMGDEDSMADLKRMQKDKERKKTEREIRREEILRARTAEREVRLAGLREKERKTMDRLKEIARARFGD